MARRSITMLPTYGREIQPPQSLERKDLLWLKACREKVRVTTGLKEIIAIHAWEFMGGRSEGFEHGLSGGRPKVARAQREV